MTDSTIGYPQKLTKRVSQKRLDQVEKIKRLLRYAQGARQDREDEWSGSERRYMGQIWASTDDATADFVSVSMSFSTIETIVPFITGGDSSFIVQPYSGDADSIRSRYLAVYLNRLWRSHKFNGQSKLRDVAWDYLLYGDGFMEIQFDLAVKSNRGADGKIIPGSGKRILELSVEQVSPWDVWMDPNASDLSSARWYIKRVSLPLETLKDDARYFNTADLEADTSSLTENDGRLFQTLTSQESNAAEDYITVFDFYDADRRLLVTFTSGSSLPLRWVEDVAPMLIHLPNHPIPNSPWHMGEIEQIASLQDELNKTRSQMITHRRRNAAKYLYRRDALTPEAIDALESGIVNKGIPIDSDLDLDNIVHPLAPNILSSDAYNVSDIIRNEIYEITGVNEYLRGAVPDTSRTATEASIIEGGSNVKVRHKLRQVEEAVRQVGQLMLDISAEGMVATDFEEMTLYLTGREAEQVLRAGGEDVYSEEGQPFDANLKPSPALFRGNYEVFVERGSTELRNPMFREQKFKEMFMVLANTSELLQQAGVQVNLKRVLEMWLEAAGVTDIDGVFRPPESQDPQVAALMQQYGQQQQQGQGGPSQGGQAGPMGVGSQAPGVPNSFGVRPPSQPITDKTSNIKAPTFGG